MALRFRRSIKLAPGIRWNVSTGGSSWTLGARGASVNLGKRGTHANLGIPLLGISSRSQLAAPKRQSRLALASTKTTTVSLKCSVDDEGNLSFTDGHGNPASEQLVQAAKKQNNDALLDLIARKCDEINSNVECLGKLHHDTPDSRLKPRFEAMPFDLPQPLPDAPLRLGFLGKLFPSKRRRVDELNAHAAERHQEAMAAWKRERVNHDRRNQVLRELVERGIYSEQAAMAQFLETRLHEISWPRETVVAMDLANDGQVVLLDVDLPEIEDMPTRLAAVPSRGLKLSVKDLSVTKVQRLYMEHVHSVLFRLIGESFAALPLADLVVASGFSQRRDPATGAMRDDYLLSVRVARADWLKIDFSAVHSIDVVEALTRFELRRNMSKTGVFKPVAPHAG